MEGKFFGGTSGLQIDQPKRDFLPEHTHLSRLGYYALKENSIEINTSFYKVPQAKTIARWASEVTDGFRFTFKLWREITHRKNLLFRKEDVYRFMEVIQLPQIRQGCLLVQFPPSLRASALPQLQELLVILKTYSWPVAVEFRHPSWYKDEVFEFLNRQQAAVVLQDMPKSATPMEITADDLVYLRFHGPSGNYKGSYSESFLSEYASYISEWQSDGKTVYVYFNNTAGAALENLHFLKRSLGV
ncbi:Uncharacterized conserved protein YecE, DUF72 family [Mucilaginibacter pineti]|uniref:Uncharacterized conserved protein YecE, DUF72 family n=1 Tax=Mucilaginibacter pineti TaxID=1391627 RepID=A0A1G6Z386_9SPHI|nr:DUF72 domain-containing protein [Mucilaginibacter pineti]SDD96315.1 Uncharacterized conserved protein YecE, DUF72 family [Mucilaginibacter pineti]